MSTKISIHKGRGDAKVELSTDTYDHTSGSAIYFHTITLSYADSSVVLFMENDDSLIDALNAIIDGAQAKLDSMMVASA